MCIHIYYETRVINRCWRLQRSVVSNKSVCSCNTINGMFSSKLKVHKVGISCPYLLMGRHRKVSLSLHQPGNLDYSCWCLQFIHPIVWLAYRWLFFCKTLLGKNFYMVILLVLLILWSDRTFLPHWQLSTLSIFSLTLLLLSYPYASSVHKFFVILEYWIFFIEELAFEGSEVVCYTMGILDVM